MPAISHRRFSPRLPAAALALTLTALGPGCAVRYYDARTGTEHLWGLGHVKVRVAPAEGAAPPAVATQIETLGLGVTVGGAAQGGAGASALPGESGLVLGWERRTRLLVPPDSALGLEWPGPQLFDVRIGAAAPSPSASPTSSASPASPSASPASP